MKLNIQNIKKSAQKGAQAVAKDTRMRVLAAVLTLFGGYVGLTPDDWKSVINELADESLRTVKSWVSPTETQIVREDGSFNFVDYKRVYGDDTEALQKLFKHVGEQGRRTSTINLNGATIRPDTAITLPKFTNSHRMTINGQGALFLVEDGQDGIVEHPDIKGMSVSFGSDDSNVIKYVMQVTIRDVVFRGGKTQVRLVAQRNSRIEDCAFELSDRGAALIFCQNCWIEDSEFQFQNIEAAVFRSGVSDGTLISGWGYDPDMTDEKYFTNSTSSNSQSNRSGTRNNWYFGKPGQACQLRVQGSDGFTSINDVFEGAPTKYAFFADSRNSPTTHTVNLIAPHIEQGNPSVTQALIYSRAFNNTYIERLYSQIPGIPILQVEDGAYPQVVFDNLSSIPMDNPSFLLDKNTTLVFRDPAMDLSNFRSWSRYSGGVPGEIGVTKGSQFFSFGPDGARLASWQIINGKTHESSFTLKGHTVVEDHMQYRFRGTNVVNYAKKQYN